VLQLKVMAEHDYTISTRPVYGSLIHDAFRTIYVANMARFRIENGTVLIDLSLLDFNILIEGFIFLEIFQKCFSKEFIKD
jgi:hypothetical protein